MHKAKNSGMATNGTSKVGAIYIGPVSFVRGILPPHILLASVLLFSTFSDSLSFHLGLAFAEQEWAEMVGIVPSFWGLDQTELSA